MQQFSNPSSFSFTDFLEVMFVFDALKNPKHHLPLIYCLEVVFAIFDTKHIINP